MKETTFLRLKEIEIHDFMGVEYGKIAFSNVDEEYNNGWEANVIGIYGPNGSGKSTLLDALKLLKEVLKDEDPAVEKILKGLGMGQGMKKVRFGCSHATLAFSFHICSSNGPEWKTLTYSFKIKEEDDFEMDDEEFKITDKEGKEILSLSCHNLEGNYMKRDALTTAMTGIQKGSPEFRTAMKKARAIWRRTEYRHSLLLEFGKEFGYITKEMETFLSRNPGLRSRISFHVHFRDYTPKELLSILKLFISEAGMDLEDAATPKLLNIFKEATEQKDFGNGRFARNLFEQARLRQASRVLHIASPSDADIRTLTADDFIEPERKEEKRCHIGFVF